MAKISPKRVHTPSHTPSSMTKEISKELKHVAKRTKEYMEARGRDLLPKIPHKISKATAGSTTRRIEKVAGLPNNR